MMPQIELVDVGRHYGPVRAVDGVSLTAETGEILALAGHNGAGKTTLLKLMLGLARPTAGRVQICGKDPASDGRAFRRLPGYLPEQVAFSPALSGRETLAFYAGLKGSGARAVTSLIERVGLGAAADRPVATYSKGMRQRLGLAQAIVADPAILFLDEPTSGLDPEVRRQLYAIIRALALAGTTVVLSSHALAELEGNADRIVILHRGRKIADGTLDSLRSAARLPERMRLSATESPDSLRAWLGPQQALRQIGERTLEFTVSPGEKMALLRRLGPDSTPCSNVEILPPTLDELYAHFLASKDAA